jgi:hypothetical protein
MDKISIGFAGVLFMLAANADAQTLSNRTSGAVAGVGSVVGGATAGVSGVGGPGGSLANPANGPGTGSSVGGHLPGALGIKAGDRVIELRGAASVGDDRGNFKAGLGVPF